VSGYIQRQRETIAKLVEQAEQLRSDLVAARDERDSARASEAALRERVTNCVNHLRDVTAAARRNQEPKTGMQVPYHGEFASAVPSVIRDLEWFCRAFERALTPVPSTGAGQGEGTES